ncbi:3-hydroxyacyl-CoA dehydrogenase NAD-binding domain-containing protein [Rhodococcus sp. 14-2483-1-2]|uniref:3-hydroxyacyl-CoA dehydrogenase NAD-binding domain-containing protein n=1 Tax=Rhodococcus sp. 14-2483-1-2 TaxID=2023147 RepID=UPI000B9B4D29|nr:3-hydroxyacyl-CoA dehydrogenase NAD-binding domain-containing protein [Rhodococcus sp. 14-2483-1-2]OZF39577.1 3-hydroxyacyl-CoA dehydrogenase [Rhodococcus sp. 14-2483-1-2]
MTTTHTDERSTITFEQDTDGIVTLTLDDPEQSVNTMNDAYRRSMAQALVRLRSSATPVTGIVLTSAKKTFFAGGDLNDLFAATTEDAPSVTAFATDIKDVLRDLETFGVPVVAALNGAALGGGLEIALACHHRIALAGKHSRFGLPEVTLGLLPGGGGVVRTVRLLGVRRALDSVLLGGRTFSAEQALDVGLVDEVLNEPDQLISRAKAWIIANPGSVARWDEPTYVMPGGSIALGSPATGDLSDSLAGLMPSLRKQFKGGPMPASRNILCAAVEGAQVDFETAAKIETRYFVELVCGQISKNMIQAFFFDTQGIKSGQGRPTGFRRRDVRKVVVLGAGMMGAGIAYSCARSGMDTVLKDVTEEAAEKGKNYAQTLCDNAVAKAAMSRTDADALLARIVTTAGPAAAEGADLVIEAVFEDPELKKRVLAEVEPFLAHDAVISSNTSTIPITDLATGTTRPADFIGLHFFSPVEKMELVEIIAGARTSDATLARAYDVVQQLGQTPIVVNDNRGFYTSRVILNRLLEAASMLGDGVEPASIERASTLAGYPVGTLALLDELTLALPRKIRGQFKEAVESNGGVYERHPGEDVLEYMVVENNRPGRSAGAGFYEYEGGTRAGFWAGLAALGTNDAPVDFLLGDLADRLLFSEVLDTVRCFDENVLRSAADANIGSIYGIGFPAWTGGTVQFIVGYNGGVAGFVERARDLAAKYGQRFDPPASLVDSVETRRMVWA